MQFQNTDDLKDFLDAQVDRFNRPEFIEADPISIPHRFSKKEDIEIMGLWAAILAWGQRPTILAKCRQLIQMMDGSPHQFITSHKPTDLKPFEHFKHRTFNGTDALYFIHFLRFVYQKYGSLESAFCEATSPDYQTIEAGLIGFKYLFTSLPDYPNRTGKHISSPNQNSACKRLNMFLRWMVRSDDKGVDFGIWKQLKPSQLICPCDVHVERIGRLLGLILRPKPDWQMAIELTENLRQFDAEDPVKYDFALFGLGVDKYFNIK